jgi:6-phosphogluconolactonase (cycloisomerase 2 family)
VTSYGNWIYVLNAGSASIAGFSVQDDGSVAYVPGSALPLSSPTAQGAQIGFSKDGDMLAVSEKNTNSISSYQVDWNGMATRANGLGLERRNAVRIRLGKQKPAIGDRGRRRGRQRWDGQ